MDALDEFFATWSEPEAWCGICATRPAIHVVLRDTGSVYGGVTSHVRIWDPAMQMHVAVCRQCCQQRMEYLGHWGKDSHTSRQRPSSRPDRARMPSQMQLPPWVRRLVERTRALLHLSMSRWRRW